MRNPALLVGLGIVGLVVLLAIFAPLLAPHDYRDQQLPKVLLPPFWQARADLIAGSLGVSLGLIAGYFGRFVDDAIMRLVDVQLSFPPIFLVIAIMAVIGQSLLNVVLVLGLVTWVQYARVVRGTTLSVKEKDYVEGARACGAGHLRILLRHILPNILPSVVVIATVNVSTLILAEAALSFLGLGVQPPTPAWGTMLAEGREVFRIAWWTAVFPGLAILITVLGINLLGDGLDAR